MSVATRAVAADAPPRPEDILAFERSPRLARGRSPCATPCADIALRLGIIAGGSRGGRHRADCTLLGLGVNIAARLQGACPPGSIPMSERVFAPPDPAPAARDMGALEPRGVPRPLSVFAVTGRA